MTFWTVTRCTWPLMQLPQNWTVWTWLLAWNGRTACQNMQTGKRLYYYYRLIMCRKNWMFWKLRCIWLSPNRIRKHKRRKFYCHNRKLFVICEKPHLVHRRLFPLRKALVESVQQSKCPARQLFRLYAAGNGLMPRVQRFCSITRFQKSLWWKRWIQKNL